VKHAVEQVDRNRKLLLGVGTRKTHCCLRTSVTRSGEISPFGRIFCEKYRLHDLSAIFSEKNSKIRRNKV
jgi:hypothetical protein